MGRRLLAAGACVVLAVVACACTPTTSSEAPSIRLAVLGAFDQEVALLDKMLTDVRSQRIEGIEFVSGRIGDQPVVIAWTGVGKVNAAMVTTLLIEHFKPAQVVFTGIAGAVDPNLEPGDIVIARQTAYHDMGSWWPEGIEPGGVKNRLTGETNPVFFPADLNLLAAAERAGRQTQFDPIAHRNGSRLPKVVVGTIVTGDTFVSSKDKCVELAEKLDADAVEMEGAAVAQVCYQRGIGYVVIRSIADKAAEGAVVDKQKFYAMAAKNSATLVAAILKGLEP